MVANHRTSYITLNNSVTTLASLYKYPTIHLPSSDIPSLGHNIIRYRFKCEKRGGCNRRHNLITSYKNIDYIALKVLSL